MGTIDPKPLWWGNLEVFKEQKENQQSSSGIKWVGRQDTQTRVHMCPGKLSIMKWGCLFALEVIGRFETGKCHKFDFALKYILCYVN